MMLIERVPVVTSTLSRGSPATLETRSGATSVMMSASLLLKAATRAAGSGISRKASVSMAGAPPQYSWFAASVTRSSLTHDWKRYGPVPTGCVAT